MRNRFYVIAGIVGIIGLVAMQWAIIINAPDQSYNNRASASEATGSNLTVVTAVADTYTSSRSPNSNYGSESKLVSEKQPQKTIFIKFDLTAYKSAQITEDVLLKIKAQDESQGQEISLVSSSDWNEKTLTHNTKPSIVQSVSYAPMKRKAWNIVHIQKQFVQDKLGSFLTLAINDANSDDTSYYSRETSSPPQLLLNLIYPKITITSPAANTTVLPNFNIDFTLENWEIQNPGNHIRVFVDSTDAGDLFIPNYAPVSNLTPGAHTITLKLVNAANVPVGVEASVSVGVSTPISPVFPTGAPSIKITSPKTDSYVSSGFDVRFETSNWKNEGQQGNHVQVFVDDIDRGPVLISYAPFSGLPTGSYKITLKLVDGTNKPLGPEDTIQVKIPSLKITSPMVGYAVAPNFDVKFTTYNWGYSPNEKRMAKVIVDGNEVGPLVLENYAPFSGMTPGVHVIRLELTENGASLYGSTVYDEVMVLVQE